MYITVAALCASCKDIPPPRYKVVLHVETGIDTLSLPLASEYVARQPYAALDAL